MSTACTADRLALSLAFFALTAWPSLHGCALPADSQGAFVDEPDMPYDAEDAAEDPLGEAVQALPCRDCEPRTPPGPAQEPVRSLPWARAIKPGKKVDIKFHVAEAGFNVYLTALSTTWERTDQTKISTVLRPNFEFSIEKIAPTTCRINMFFDFYYDISQVGSGWFDENIHGDYYCYTQPHTDESDGNNGGYELAVPELLMTVWAKREDRIRIDFMKYQGDEEIIEIDTDENS